MERLGYLLAGTLCFFIIFAMLEWLFAEKPYQKRLRSEIKTDIIYWLFTPLITKFITRIGIAFIVIITYNTSPQEVKTFLSTRDTWIASQPAWIQFPLMLFIGDVIGYIVHRQFHRKYLWKFHAIHHSSKELDWLSATRLHPINDWVSRWCQFMALLLIGFSFTYAVGYTVFISFYAIFIHANISWSYGPFRYVLASPRFHRWHHTSEEEGLDKNFAGFFPVIDIIGGTFYMPKERVPEQFGLAGEQIPANFLSQMLYPFKKSE